MGVLRLPSERQSVGSERHAGPSEPLTKASEDDMSVSISKYVALLLIVCCHEAAEISTVSPYICVFNCSRVVIVAKDGIMDVDMSQPRSVCPMVQLTP